MNKRKILVVFSSALMLALLTTSMVVAPSVVGTLNSCPADPVPVIDGVLGVSEWKEGVPELVELYDLDDQLETMDIEIMSLYDNDNRIYFGITYLDDKLNPEDWFFLIFRDVEGTDICAPPHNASGKFNDNHDMKFMWLYNNLTVDQFTKAPGYSWASDVSNGGADNGIGKCHENGTHVTIEMRFPFNTGDTLGYDIALSLGITVKMFIGLFDGDKGIRYYQIRENDLDYDLLDLIVQCTAATPIPVIYILIGLMVTSVVSIIYKKKRK
ncbi:MAG: hypothetical protein FK732_06285 [Asgard group archaeon]|nr:hypothetical protein [Asgard group archaeon]